MAAKSTTKPRKSQPEREPDDAVIDNMPPDAVLAALCNHKFGFSTIKAFGKNKHKAVAVEQFGETFRLKRTTYQYFASLDDAIALAKKEKIKIQLF